ncbi:MAG: primosome assembly protein PriA, partial [Bacteroidales bacterium]|nr:primosome assembly protein PriA [Bacteroidales bacterium]
MAYQTVTKTSYGSRVKNSFKGIGSGIMMIIIATVLLFWNEGRAVKMTKALKETEKVTVEMPDINIVDPQFEGKVVHATGTSKTECILKDDAYGVSENAVKLNRTVEYYQWVEHQEQETKDKIGGGQETVTTYTYEKKWVSRPENSSKFADPEYKSSNHILVEVANANQI